MRLQAVAASIDPHLVLRHRPPCHGRLACDLQAFTLPEFVVPLVFGLAAVGVGVIVSLGWRAVRRLRHTAGSESPTPIAGLLFAGTALAGYQWTGHLPSGLGFSIGLLIAGGLIGQIASLPSILRLLLIIPGAAALATESAMPDPEWVRLLAAVLTVVGFGLIESLDRRHDRVGLGPVLLAVSMVGLYETVPDPDFALLLLGAALPLVLVGWPVPLGRLGGSGAAAAAGFFAWADAVGGRGRLGTVIAGAGCLGLFAIEPPARILLRGTPTAIERFGPRTWAPVIVAFIQLCLAAACTRIAPAGRSPTDVGVIAGVSLIIAILLISALSERLARPGVEDQGGPASLKRRSPRRPRARHLTPW